MRTKRWSHIQVTSRQMEQYKKHNINASRDPQNANKTDNVIYKLTFIKIMLEIIINILFKGDKNIIDIYEPGSVKFIIEYPYFAKV